MSQSLLELGLDVTEIEKSLDGLTKKFEASMEKNAKATGKMTSAVGKVTGALRTMLGAVGIGVGFKSLVDLMMNAGKAYEENVNKYIAGSERLKNRQGGAEGAAGIEIATASTSSDFGAKMKARLTAIMATVIAGFVDKPEDKSRKIASGNEAAALFPMITAKEDEIANIRSRGVITLEQQKTIQEKLVELAQLKGAYAQNEVIADRELNLQAAEAAGAATQALSEAKFQREQGLNAAMATTDAMEQERDGRKDVANLARIQAKYEADILAAQRAGNSELEKELNAQRDIDTMRARVAEHNMTPRERLDERRVARKYARDSTKTTEKEAELKRRSDQMIREGHHATPGSELDRFQQRGTLRVGGRTDFQNNRDLLQKIAASVGAWGQNKP